MIIRVSIILFVAVLSATLAWLLLTYDFSALTRLSPTITGVAVGLSLLYSWLYGLGVKLILNSVGVRLGVGRVFLVISGGGTASYLGNVQLGIPLRLILYNRLFAIPYALSAASVALETAAWFGLMSLGLVLAGTPSNYAPWVAILALICGSLLAYRYALPMATLLLHLLPKAWFGMSLGGVRKTLCDLILALQETRWSWLAAAVLVFSVNYAIDATTVWLIVRNYGEHIAIWDALEAIILSYLAGLVSMLPMGLGVRDVSMVALLSGNGVSTEVATTTALVLRILRTAIPLLIGLVAINWLGLRAIINSANTDSQAPMAAKIQHHDPGAS